MKNSRFLFLVLISIGILVPQLSIYNHLCDDAYISFRYAQRLVDGEGLTFNPKEKVEGFSNPLWIFILSIFNKITTVPITDLSRIFGILCSILTLVCLYTFFVRIRDDFYGFIFSSTFLLCIPGYHVYSTAGLETPLFTLLLTAGLICSYRNNINFAYLSALIFGLITITRPEGVLYSIAWLLVYTINNRDRYTRKQILTFLLIVVSPFILYMIFRFAYFESLIPNTAIAKAPRTFNIMGIFLYYLPFIKSLGGPLFILGLLLAFKYIKKRERALFGILLVLILCNILFNFYSQGDWMPFGRFIIPIIPILSIVLGVIASIFLKYIVHRNNKLVFIILVFTVIYSPLEAFRKQIGGYIRNEGYNMLMRGTDQVTVGKWISENVNKSATVATIRLGGISYMAKNQIFWDLLGLTDQEQARFIAKGRRGLLHSPVIKRNPDVIAQVVSPKDHKTDQISEYFQWLDKNYTKVNSFKQGNWDSFDVWVNNTKKCSVLKQEYLKNCTKIK